MVKMKRSFNSLYSTIDDILDYVESVLLIEVCKVNTLYIE
jgi:hypothetical protein